METAGHLAPDPYPEDLRHLVEEHLASLRFTARVPVEGLEEAMRYSLLAGGKRIRPVLALATARAVGLEPRSILDAACAIELIHTYSLIHDDLPAMDDDALRRGQPTCHVAHGEDVAILAGDGLFAEAVGLLAAHRGPPERVLEALRELAGATGVEGMVGGQYVDVRGGELGPEELRELHELKTGRLISASVGVALALAGLDDSARMPFRRFAAELGVLFQIVDDILDVTGTDEALGKPHGSDERHGKRTYVTAFGLSGARRMAAEAHEAARGWLRQTGRDTADLERITDFIHTRQS